MVGRKEVRRAIANVLDIQDFTTVAYMQFPPLPPMIEVYPAKSQYDYAINTDELKFKVRATVQNTISESGQELLDRLIDATGPDSVKALLETPRVLLEADPDLEGFVQDVTVEEVSDYHLYPVGDGSHILGIELTVCVLTTRPVEE